MKLIVFFNVILFTLNQFILNQKIEYDHNNFILRRLTQKEEIQKLNNIIYIYNPFDIVSYISCITNTKGDLFITINPEQKSTKRLIYAIKSDGSTYFNDTDNKPYKIMNSTWDLNKYPLLSFLKFEDNEYLITFTQNSMFELFDLYSNLVYNQGIFQIIGLNSNINKNTFTRLNYYNNNNNNNYILNSYIEKRNRNFLLQILNFTKLQLDRSIEVSENKVGESWHYSSATCFETLDLIECLYVDRFRLYTIAIFNISNLEVLHSENIEESSIRSDELFSKCIYIKDYIGAFIYFRENNTIPKLNFKKLNIASTNNTSIFEIEDYRAPIFINRDQKYYLGNNYIYNDIIKFNENDFIYVNTKNESDILMIIMIKLSEESKNILINYYKIELKEKYNIRIYKDMNIFKFNELLGIAMTNYNFNLSSKETYASYFIIGESFTNLTLPNNINIFEDDDDGNKFQIKIEDFIDIKNNIFGYEISEIKIISNLREELLGFYLYSNELQKKIEANDSLPVNDTIHFKLIEESGVKLDNYIIEYEGRISEPDYNTFISFPDSYENYPYDNSSFEQFYKPNTFAFKKGYINIFINYCFRTCKACSYLGNNVNHFCDTCSDGYPLKQISNSISGINCFKECPDNYSLVGNICLPDEENRKTDKNKIIDLIGIDNYNEITKKIKDVSDNQMIFTNNSNYNIYGYEISEEKEKFFYDNDLIYIDFINSNIKDSIIKNLNLDNDTKIYALIVDINSTYKNPLTNEFYMVLLYENGTEIIINDNIVGRVNISAPITDFEAAHYDYAVYFNEQGYDIYNKNSSFYNDICLSVSYINNDLTIKDRQEEIYPNNMTIVNPNCEYKAVDLEKKRLICQFNILDLYKNNSYNEKKNGNFFEIQEENFIYYLLDYINYKILVCQNAFFHLKNYKNNLGLLFSSITSFIIVVLIVIFYIHGLYKIKMIFYNEMPNSKKIKELIRKNITLNKKDIESIDNKVNKNSVNNPGKKKIKKVKFGKNARPPKNDIILLSKSSGTNGTNSIGLQRNEANSLTKSINEINSEKNSINNIYNKKKYKYKVKTSDGSSLKKKGRIKKYFKGKKRKEQQNQKEDYNNLPFNKAIIKDKRNIFQLLKEKIMDKLEIIGILISKEIKELYLSKFFLFLLIDVTMTALLFSDSVISHKFHNNGQLDGIVNLTLSIASNLLSLLIEHYISLFIRYEEIIDQIKEIKKEKEFIKVSNRYYKIIIVQTIFFSFLSLDFILFCIYYLVVFCAIYPKSQISLLKAYFTSLIEGIVTNIIIAVFISGTRIYGIRFKNKYIFNTSNYIDQKF